MSRWFGRRRGRALTAWLVALGVTAALAAADVCGLLLHGGGDLRAYDGRTARVERILDGPTLVLDRPAAHVRLAGVVAGDDATDFVRRRCHRQPVTLRLEPHAPRDDAGRVLAFVELPDGSMLNELLLIEGLARADTAWSHRHSDRFDLLQRQARSDKRGLWATTPRP